MGLSQDIVVVNEYTIRLPDGSGTRGSSPGTYVSQYMGRADAVEDLTPVRFDAEDYILRYQARRDAAETLPDVPSVKKGMRAAQGKGGVAFGYGDISLSHRALKRASKDIQRQFNKGKTVLKTVLSFTEEYLKSAGCLPADFLYEEERTYRGHLDQMKLRMAIMNGLRRLSADYDDLRYVGVIQVDTAHVHCHLCMVDAGKGMLMPDGTQKGKLSGKQKDTIRRGIDLFLEQKQMVRQMSSNITRDKRNAVCYIKSHTYKQIDRRGVPQFLVSCLPADRRLWRAKSNRKEMRKANACCREMVEQILMQPDSGFTQALLDIERYARERQMREDLSDTEYRKLRQNGRERIVTSCMDAVYGVLAAIPEEELRKPTPMMHAMSMDYDDMSFIYQDDPMLEFGFRLRTYASRLDHHKEMRDRYHEARVAFEQTSGDTSQAMPLYRYFEYEEQYQSMCMCKYQYFLSFLPPSYEWEEDLRRVLKERERVLNLRRLMEDESVSKMGSLAAEDYGRRVYGVSGGHYLIENPALYERRVYDRESRYQVMESDFKYKLAGYGLSFTKDGHVSSEKSYAFDDVKALDIHHLGYDFPDSFPISRRNVDNFVYAADVRYRLYQGAVQYLVGSGQRAAIEALPGADVHAMKNLADQLRMDPTMPSFVERAGGRVRKSKMPSLDYDYTKRLEQVVLEAVPDSEEIREMQ